MSLKNKALWFFIVSLIDQFTKEFLCPLSLLQSVFFVSLLFCFSMGYDGKGVLTNIKRGDMLQIHGQKKIPLAWDFFIKANY